MTDPYKEIVQKSTNLVLSFGNSVQTGPVRDQPYTPPRINEAELVREWKAWKGARISRRHRPRTLEAEARDSRPVLWCGRVFVKGLAVVRSDPLPDFSR